MPFQDPIVGGIQLRIPAIQSPGFQAGVSGWTVNIDGSAEFNDLTVRGTFFGADFEMNENGLFLYSGMPRTGNLLFSLAAVAGTDEYSNPYFENAYLYGAAGNHVGLDFFGPGGNDAAVVASTGDTDEVKAGAFQSSIGGTGATRFLLAQLFSPQFASESGRASVRLQSQSDDGTTLAEDASLATGTQQFGVNDGFGGVSPFSYTSAPLLSGTRTGPETWHSLASSLQNSWTIFTGRGLYYRLMPDNTVSVTGRIVVPVGVGNPSVICQLPAGYRPLNRPESVQATNVNAAGTSASEPYVEINPSGNLSCFSGPASGTSISFQGRYPLDCPV